LPLPAAGRVSHCLHPQHSPFGFMDPLQLMNSIQLVLHLCMPKSLGANWWLPSVLWVTIHWLDNTYPLLSGCPSDGHFSWSGTSVAIETVTCFHSAYSQIFCYLRNLHVGGHDSHHSVSRVLIKSHPRRATSLWSFMVYSCIWYWNVGFSSGLHVAVRLPDVGRSNIISISMLSGHEAFNYSMALADGQADYMFVSMPCIDATFFV
jgi:hypothetical protein